MPKMDDPQGLVRPTVGMGFEVLKVVVKVPSVKRV